MTCLSRSRSMVTTQVVAGIRLLMLLTGNSLGKMSILVRCCGSCISTRITVCRDARTTSIGCPSPCQLGSRTGKTNTQYPRGPVWNPYPSMRKSLTVLLVEDFREFRSPGRRHLLRHA